ncbi:NUC141 domain-containing protein [Melampsora americana]|nr:NUC141 domain-containing protein [Melampsora americana]
MLSENQSKSNQSTHPKDKGKGKSKAKERDQEYQVESNRLKTYLNESERLVKRDLSAWKTQTQNDTKLSSHLSAISARHLNTASKSAEHDDLLLSNQTSGSLIQVENALEKTWKVTQSDIKSSVGISISNKSFGLALEGGPFKFDYTRNGRFLSLAGHQFGHLSTLDWKSSKLMTDFNVHETTRSIRWLHNQSFFAVAQRRYVFIYDGHQGTELHQLRGHLEVTQMEFLPYHFLLSTIGLPGWLKYHDTSTGQMVSQHRTKLGACHTMSQNPFNSIIHLGHQNGTISLWSPSISQAQVKILGHRGPVTSVSIDPSSSGRLMATTGLDSTLKIWDLRTYKTLNEWTLKKPAKTSDWSQKSLLAVGWGSHVSIYSGLGKNEAQRGTYMSERFPSQAVEQVQFCPFEDVLGVGHTSGFSSLIIPGSGEANFDSLEADPFENKSRRREREVRGLMDKIPFDLITLNPEMVGSIADPILKESEELKRLKGNHKPTAWRTLTRAEKLAAQGKSGEEERLDDDDDDEQEGVKDQAIKPSGEVKEKEKKKMRGKNSSLKRVLRKKHKNVITPEVEALRAKIALRKQKMTSLKTKEISSGTASGSIDALSRFSNKR